MNFFLLNITYIALLLSAGQGQCNTSNWEEYYPDMQYCDLSGASFEGANLSGADLVGANLNLADLSGADLAGANFLGAELYKANLSGANISNSNFYNTNLSGANFSGANDIETNYYHAYISGVCVEAGALNLIWFYEEGGVFGTPIFEGCAEGSFEDTDADGHDEASFAAGAASLDSNNDGLIDEFPIISILEGCATVLIQGSLDQYTDSGASCSDQEDGDISQNVAVSGQVVNINIPGTYTVSYNCSDSDGNVAQTKDRRVFVIPPIIADENEDGFDDDGFIAGAQSGDITGDGILNVADLVAYINIIIN